MAASDFGDGSVVGGLLHWDRYAFWGGAQLLGCLSGAFGAYDKLGVISHSGMEFLFFTTFLLGIFFVSPSCTHFFFLSIFIIYYLGIFFVSPSCAHFSFYICYLLIRDISLSTY